MKCRKRTRNGKSLKMNVSESLKMVANTNDDITLSFTIDYFDTQFNLTLSEIEIVELNEKFNKWLKGE